MTEQISTRSEDRIISELSAMRQSMDSMRTTMEDKFEIALKPIERGLRSITLIPLALIFGGLSSWLFYVGKISESTWFWLTVFLMMPFFGEGARLILDKLPLTKTAAVLKVGILCLGIAILSACALTVPLGEGGRYGYLDLEGRAKYRPPQEILGQPVFVQEVYRDK
jgi:hypothetical protein